MDLSPFTLVLLPLGLGILGFLEPCTIGGHLVFLDTQVDRSTPHRVAAALMFTAARSLMMGLFGALIGLLGQTLISIQTSAWFAFGVIYLLLGLTFLLNWSSLFKQKIELAPVAWTHARNPVVLGFSLGLNIPACAAPILFGLLALAATAGSALAGFLMMFLFGLALSIPLVAVALAPTLSERLNRIGHWMKRCTWLIGLVFVLIGVWSIWFGLYVDPANWADK